MEFPPKKKAGIYIHIPFCAKKCPYCDFYSITDLSLTSGFANVLLQEMGANRLDTLFFDTLYIGGGTPSILDGNQIYRILEGAFRYFKVMPGAELTMEINPGTVNLSQLREYRQAGINRINIGIQSFQDPNLDFLGRIHCARDANLSFDWAIRAGFANIGIDLIYGLPRQTKTNWLKDLEHAVRLQPTHLSCYMLTCEPGTPLHQDMLRGKVKAADDGNIRQLFDFTAEYLEFHEYIQYEVSNFARSDEAGSEANRSRHNMKYWSLAPYIGFGPSAHSFLEPKRYWNYADVKKYIHEIEAGRPAVEETELLTSEQIMMEAVYLQLRTAAGIDLAGFNQKFDLDFVQTFDKIIAGLEKDALLKLSRSHCALTRKGLAFLDTIVPMFTSQKI
jgi:oxygen-independent coproporphyrinogen-3 oxidase